MKVGELVEHLQKLDPEADIFIDDSDFDEVEIFAITQDGDEVMLSNLTPREGDEVHYLNERHANDRKL